MASNTIPFQPAYSLNPKYGFRYGPSSFVGSTTKAGGNPVGGLNLNNSDSYGVPPLNNPTVTSGNSTMDGGDSDNGSAQASIDMSTQASLANNGKQADTDPNMIASSLVGFLGTAAGVPLSGAAGFGTVPRDGYTGSEGTIGPNGGMFNSAGREIDQRTGQAYNSYGSGSQFYNGTYMSNIRDQDTIGGALIAGISDPDNAFDYEEPGSVMNEFGDRYGSKEEQFAKSKGLDTTSPEFKQTVLLDKGIPPSSLDGENNPTVAAMDINNYSPTNAAPAGSQYSMTGNFSTGSNDSDNGDPGGGASGTSNDPGGATEGVWAQGGLIPPPNMSRRAQDVPNPMMQDPLEGLL